MSTDRGLAQERTALAWERTALAALCGAVVIARITYARLGPLALCLLVVSASLAALVLLDGRSRTTRRGRRRVRLRSGRMAAAISASTLALALAEFTALLR